MGFGKTNSSGGIFEIKDAIVKTAKSGEAITENSFIDLTISQPTLNTAGFLPNGRIVFPFPDTDNLYLCEPSVRKGEGLASSGKSVTVYILNKDSNNQFKQIGSVTIQVPTDYYLLQVVPIAPNRFIAIYTKSSYISSKYYFYCGIEAYVLNSDNTGATKELSISQLDLSGYTSNSSVGSYLYSCCNITAVIPAPFEKCFLVSIFPIQENVSDSTPVLLYLDYSSGTLKVINSYNLTVPINFGFSDVASMSNSGGLSNQGNYIKKSGSNDIHLVYTIERAIGSVAQDVYYQKIQLVSTTKAAVVGPLNPLGVYKSSNNPTLNFGYEFSDNGDVLIRVISGSIKDLRIKEGEFVPETIQSYSSDLLIKSLYKISENKFYPVLTGAYSGRGYPRILNVVFIEGINKAIALISSNGANYSFWGNRTLAIGILEGESLEKFANFRGYLIDASNIYSSDERLDLSEVYSEIRKNVFKESDIFSTKAYTYVSGAPGFTFTLNQFVNKVYKAKSTISGVSANPTIGQDEDVKYYTIGG